MLNLVAQEICENLSAMMERSIIITDIDGVIIGSPNKERIGEFHPPSVACIKYKKMSFDDAEAAKEQGVWYPGSTVPIFFQDQVIGTAAIAGEPGLVLQFTALVKKQIESMLREKIFAHAIPKSQRIINELVKNIASLDPFKEADSTLVEQARRAGINLDLPRGVISLAFSNLHGLYLAKNPTRLAFYENKGDPLSDEIDRCITNNMVIEILREIFHDPHDIVASVSHDKFVIFWTLLAYEKDDPFAAVTRVKELCDTVKNRLNESAVEMVIGIGFPAKNICELPHAYNNAWEVNLIANKLGMRPGIYCFSDMLFEHLLLSLHPRVSLKYMEKSVGRLFDQDNSNELIATFYEYCRCFFVKQKAAENLHIHRNTLAYRLSKIEDCLEISLDNFENITALYMFLIMRALNNKESAAQ